MRLLRSRRPNCPSSFFSTVSEAIETLKSRFEAEFIPEAELSAKHLVAAAIERDSTTQNLQQGHTLKQSEPTNERSFQPKRSCLVEEKVLTAAQVSTLERWSRCRLSRMPVQFIVGDWDFRHLTLQVRPPVFIPRPETEQLVQFVLDHVKEGKKVLEVGCGCGAIALSLLHERPDLRLMAVDQSCNACALTAENASNLGLLEKLKVVNDKLKGDGTLSEVNEMFDVIVSNPPYVPTKDLSRLQPEISAYEDLRALDGGVDGLEVIRSLLKLASSDKLAAGGKIFIEIDPSHRQVLPGLLARDKDLKVKVEGFHKDHRGLDRFVILSKVT